MAERKADKRDVWFVEFPTYRYTQDVKATARKADLKVIDSRHQGDQKQCAKAPTLTLKDEFKPKKIEE